MKAKPKLTKRRQDLALEYQDLVPVLAGYFLQHRPAWQRSVMRDDLEGEGFLALCKAARTYDPQRLPYPKAYFARAILNGMYKHIKKETRTPGDERVPMEVASDSVGADDEFDYLSQAIEMLAPEHQLFAQDRFQEGMTLRKLSEEHGIPLKRTSQRARLLAAQIARLLGIQLPEPKRDS